MGGARKFDRVSPLFQELKWLRIKEKHIFDTCTTVYKVLRKCYPESRNYMSFSSVTDVTSSITRQGNNLYVPRTRTDSGARALTVLGPKLWNELPTTITQAHNLNSFKTNLKKLLLSA